MSKIRVIAIQPVTGGLIVEIHPECSPGMEHSHESEKYVFTNMWDVFNMIDNRLKENKEGMN